MPGPAQEPLLQRCIVSGGPILCTLYTSHCCQVAENSEKKLKKGLQKIYCVPYGPEFWPKVAERGPENIV